MVVIDRYIDNKKELEFELALEELEKELEQEEADRAYALANIGNPMALYGAI